MSTNRYHFECPVCEFDDGELGRLATEHEIYCGMCAADNGRVVRLVRWREGDLSYKCPRCGMRSFNANDLKHRYCGNCHQFEERRP